MRIVIADDEQWVRAGLKEMLLEADSDTEIVGEALNGDHMVKLVKEEQPDIVFVDIRMPEMDGLEGIAAAREKSSDTVWVILSGYSDFQYAQRAIRLGVQEYLLKPVSPEKLRETLLNVKKLKCQRKTNRNTDFRNWIISRFYMERRDEGNGDFNELEMMGMLLYFDTWTDGRERETYLKRTAEFLEKRIAELERYGNVYCAFFMTEQRKIILATGIGAGKSRKEDIGKWYDSLRKEFFKISDKHCTLTGICTKWCDNAAKMFDCINREEWVEYCRIAAEPERVWYFEEMEEKRKSMQPCTMRMCEMLMQIAKGMHEGSYLHFIDCVVRAEKEWISCQVQTTETEYANMKRYLAVTTGINRFITKDEFRSMELGKVLSFVRENARQILNRGKTGQREEDVVKLAEDYICEHYGEDISVSQLAVQLSLTPNYLSALFHKKTGTTFVKYLTRVRMREAEKLLQNTSLPVWKIAEKTGFSDTRYFTKIFKDYYGILPSEYGN